MQLLPTLIELKKSVRKIGRLIVALVFERNSARRYSGKGPQISLKEGFTNNGFS